MAYVGTPEFEKRRPALKAAFEQSRRELEARLALIEPETAAPADVMSPAELASRLIMDDLPKE
jgi:hypothetical protein